MTRFGFGAALSLLLCATQASAEQRFPLDSELVRPTLKKIEDTNLAPYQKSCPSSEPRLLDQVSSCPGKIPIPYVADGSLACSNENLNERDYAQLVKLQVTAFKQINERRELVSQLMTCLLGTPITPALVTHALANMATTLCSDSLNKSFVVDCSNSAGASAEWDGNSPNSLLENDKGFHGSILMSASKLKKTRSGSEQSRSIETTGIIDSVVHEGVHALVAYLAKTVEGASLTGQKGSCSVGFMPKDVKIRCMPNGEELKPAVSVPYQNDVEMYQPFTDVAKTSTSKKKSRKAITDSDPYAACRKEYAKQNGGKSLSDDSKKMENRYSKDWDTVCSVPATGRWRQEVVARRVAGMVSGFSCKKSFPAFLEKEEFRR